jgi:hypothetical protein
MRQGRHWVEGEGDIRCGFTQKAGNGFWDNAPFLRPGAALDEHVEVEFFGREPFECILTDGSKMVDINVP